MPVFWIVQLTLSASNIRMLMDEIKSSTYNQFHSFHDWDIYLIHSIFRTWYPSRSQIYLILRSHKTLFVGSPVGHVFSFFSFLVAAPIYYVSEWKNFILSHCPSIDFPTLIVTTWRSTCYVWPWSSCGKSDAALQKSKRKIRPFLRRSGFRVHCTHHTSNHTPHFHTPLDSHVYGIFIYR